MQISDVQENTSLPRKVYLGIENFQATAVNPTMKELNDMGIPVTSEPEYVTKVKRDYGDGEKEYDAVNIRIYLTNKDPKNSIKTQVNYQIVRTNHLSSTNKYKVINKYGTSTWLEQSHIDKGTLPGNMAWYINEDVRKAYRGEDEFIDFLRAYSNLPNIKLQDAEDLRKKGIVKLNITDWDKIFKGDFKDIRDAIMGIGDKGKVGFLLGAKSLEDDKYVQTLYRKMPLKRYVKKVGENEYLKKSVTEAQEAGAYADSIFDLSNFELKEFTEEDKLTPTTADELYENLPVEDDDLPF